MCADTRHLPIFYGSTHTHSVPGAEWYGVPASDLLYHHMFVLLYLQTIHWTDLSGEESAPQAWIITSFPDTSRSWFGWGFPSCHEDDVPEGQPGLPSSPIINSPPVWIQRQQSNCNKCSIFDIVLCPSSECWSYMRDNYVMWFWQHASNTNHQQLQDALFPVRMLSTAPRVQAQCSAKRNLLLSRWG